MCDKLDGDARNDGEEDESKRDETEALPSIYYGDLIGLIEEELGKPLAQGALTEDQEIELRKLLALLAEFPDHPEVIGIPGQEAAIYLLASDADIPLP